MSAGHELVFEAQELRNKRRMRPGGSLFRLTIALYEVGGALAHELALLREELRHHRALQDSGGESLKQDFVAAVLGSGVLGADVRSVTVAQRFIAHGHRELSAHEAGLIDELISSYSPKRCPKCRSAVPRSDWTKAFEEKCCSWCEGLFGDNHDEEEQK